MRSGRSLEHRMTSASVLFHERSELVEQVLVRQSKAEAECRHHFARPETRPAFHRDMRIDSSLTVPGLPSNILILVRDAQGIEHASRNTVTFGKKGRRSVKLQNLRTYIREFNKRHF